MTYSTGIDWIAELRNENERLRAELLSTHAALKALVEHRRPGLTMPISDECWNQVQAAIKLVEGGG